MDIQQKENKSLAAYVHHFKKEASRCKFDNNAATIRIFIKGLKNAHNLATGVYEKGLQSLADAIKEVEKLQAAQQLTATLIPASSINIMSSDDDKCFQCQELGHMACHYPCIKCFDCGEYGHVAADCSDKIPPSGTPAGQRNTNSNTRHHGRSTSHNDHQDRHSCHDHEDRQSCHDHQDRHRFNRSRSHSNNHRYRSHRVIHEEATQGHITDLHITAHHATETQAHIATNETLHIEGPHCTEAFPEIAVDPDHVRHTKTPHNTI